MCHYLQCLALLSALPIEELSEIRIASGELSLHFDFRGDDRFKVWDWFP